MKDLFGTEITESDLLPVHKTLIQKRIGHLNYRLSDSKTECCKTCTRLIGYNYHNKNYYKCSLVGESRSSATDIKLRNVCDAFIKDGEK